MLSIRSCDASNSEILCLVLGNTRRPKALHVTRLKLDGTSQVSRPLAKLPWLLHGYNQPADDPTPAATSQHAYFGNIRTRCILRSNNSQPSPPPLLPPGPATLRPASDRAYATRRDGSRPLAASGRLRIRRHARVRPRSRCAVRGRGGPPYVNPNGRREARAMGRGARRWRARRFLRVCGLAVPVVVPRHAVSSSSSWRPSDREEEPPGSRV